MEERGSPARGISSLAGHPPAGGTVTPPAPPLSVPSHERRDRAIRAEAPHFLCPAREWKAPSCCLSTSPSRGVFELGLAGEVVGASEEGERLGAATDHLAHPRPCVFYHYHSYQRHFYVLCAKYLT